ncbi:hypothetical protein N5079_26245 [Planotetraspora sp. A-T 1434]|uniref:hypothetical protein n=1 Tax=Planotetraspora sp. A-T 1434 TaxID=2979219 RepID=UPI0021BE0473|nr:hypothetical protein [Planotetraspora sp. A-T 1434]MCT9933720.1 hypothetical protein [Planotetraspora sp. A-T 1434]
MSRRRTGQRAWQGAATRAWALAALPTASGACTALFTGGHAGVVVSIGSLLLCGLVIADQAIRRVIRDRAVSKVIGGVGTQVDAVTLIVALSAHEAIAAGMVSSEDVADVLQATLTHSGRVGL